MTAKEMFEKLNYSYDELGHLSDGAEVIQYKLENLKNDMVNIIEFSKKDKCISFKTTYKDTTLDTVLIPSEIDAVIKQVEELKENGEW